MKILKIFLVLTNLFLFVHADDHKNNHSYKNLEYLNLNTTQVKQMKDVLIEYKYKYKKFYEFKKSQEEKLEDMMKSDTFDKDKYVNVLNETKMQASILESLKMEKIHHILNNKQREKFAKYLEEWEVE